MKKRIPLSEIKRTHPYIKGFLDKVFNTDLDKLSYADSRKALDFYYDIMRLINYNFELFVKDATKNTTADESDK